MAKAPHGPTSSSYGTNITRALILMSHRKLLLHRTQLKSNTSLSLKTIYWHGPIHAALSVRYVPKRKSSKTTPKPLMLLITPTSFGLSCRILVRYTSIYIMYMPLISNWRQTSKRQLSQTRQLTQKPSGLMNSATGKRGNYWDENYMRAGKITCPKWKWWKKDVK